MCVCACVMCKCIQCTAESTNFHSFGFVQKYEKQNRDGQVEWGDIANGKDSLKPKSIIKTQGV